MIPLVFTITGYVFATDSILMVCPYTGSFTTDLNTLILDVVTEEHNSEPELVMELVWIPLVNVSVEKILLDGFVRFNVETVSVDRTVIVLNNKVDVC